MIALLPGGDTDCEFSGYGFQKPDEELQHRCWQAPGNFFLTGVWKET
jgi:hypothetical protein